MRICPSRKWRKNIAESCSGVFVQWLRVLLVLGGMKLTARMQGRDGGGVHAGFGGVLVLGWQHRGRLLVHLVS